MLFSNCFSLTKTKTRELLTVLTTTPEEESSLYLSQETLTMDRDSPSLEDLESSVKEDSEDKEEMKSWEEL